MGSLRKWILGLFLGGTVLVILLTWGSIGSAILTLALIMAGIFLALKRSLAEQEDYLTEE